ncbi:MAG TPA: hypothetical protein VF616_10040 [Duganella sp.]
MPACAALVAAGVLCAQYVRERDLVATQAAGVDAGQRQSRRAQQERAAAERDTPERARVRADQDALVAKLRYPWHRVLATLEQVSVPDVAVLSLTHNQAHRAAELTVEARDAQAINDYVAQLNGDDSDEPRWYVASLQPQPQAAVPTIRGTILTMGRAR